MRRTRATAHGRRSRALGTTRLPSTRAATMTYYLGRYSYFGALTDSIRRRRRWRWARSQSHKGSFRGSSRSSRRCRDGCVGPGAGARRNSLVNLAQSELTKLPGLGLRLAGGDAHLENAEHRACGRELERRGARRRTVSLSDPAEECFEIPARNAVRASVACARDERRDGRIARSAVSRSTLRRAP